MEPITSDNKWQSRIEQKRTGPYAWDRVVNYVNRIVRDHHVPIDDVAPFLLPNELQAITTMKDRRNKLANKVVVN